MDPRNHLLLVITDDTEMLSTLVHVEHRGMIVKVWCPNKQSTLQHDIQGACGSCDESDLLFRGDLSKAAFYIKWIHFRQIYVILSFKDADRHSETRSMLLEHLPQSVLLSLTMGSPAAHPRCRNTPRETNLTWAELLERPLAAEVRHIYSAHLVRSIRALLGAGDHIALLLQPDPDPDALASALALRTILGRNKASTPIVTFGKVTRPENLAMMRMLDIEVHTIQNDDLNKFDRVALLDTQPAHFSELLTRVDVVIDHHPCHTSYEHIPFVDIRNHYGATSTILTEYLRAAAIPIGTRLATALLYGIKADTLHLNRGVSDADLDAFVSLYPNINYNMLRRIEKPELPKQFAPVLADALKALTIESGILVSCLGNVEREDLIPQIADFLLQFEDVEWVVCAGIFESRIIMSVRNVGYVKNAGDVVKKIVATIGGMGGGHRTMAKVIIPVAQWKQHFGSVAIANIREQTFQLFAGVVV